MDSSFNPILVIIFLVIGILVVETLKENSRRTQTMDQKIDKKRWWQYRKISREEAGKTALLGLLGITISSLFIKGVVIQNLTDIIFGFMSGIGGIIWIIESIRRRGVKEDGKLGDCGIPQEKIDNYNRNKENQK